MKPFIVTDDYSGMGSFVEALKYLGIPPEELALWRSENDPRQNAIFHSIHGNWLDKLADYKHIEDATSADASPEGIQDWIQTTFTDVDGDARPDLMSITSPCLGGSRMNTSKTKQVMNNEASATLIPVMERVRKLNPKDAFHEMVDTASKKKYAGSETFDILLNDLTGDIVHKTDFNNPEHVRQMHQVLKDTGLYKPKLLLHGEDFSPQTNAHEFRATYPLGIDNVFGSKLFHRSTAKNRLFNPNVYLNVEREPGESLVDYALRLQAIPDASLGDNPFLAGKGTLNRSLASNNKGLSNLYYTLERNAANFPVQFRAIDTPSEVDMPYIETPTGKSFIAKDKEELTYLEDPKGVYRQNKLPGVVTTNSKRGKPSFRLTGDDGSLVPGNYYIASKLMPEQQARIMGWGPNIVNAARKAGLADHEILSSFGNAYPLHQAIIVLLQSPELWKRFPEQMKRARDDFLRYEWSDLRLKEVVPSDAMIKAIKRPLWIEHRRN